MELLSLWNSSGFFQTSGKHHDLLFPQCWNRDEPYDMKNMELVQFLTQLFLGIQNGIVIVIQLWNQDSFVSDSSGEISYLFCHGALHFKHIFKNAQSIYSMMSVFVYVWLLKFVFLLVIKHITFSPEEHTLHMFTKPWVIFGDWAFPLYQNTVHYCWFNSLKMQ